jgi:2-keto-4-pentenoate hydratase/2-oxohepta-3-ene-1,7-dioic acid hydratase in catechol pathway
MKLVLFTTPDQPDPQPGAWVDEGVVPFGHRVRTGHSAQHTIECLIDDFEHIKGDLQAHVEQAKPITHGAYQLKAPLPRPGKILCCIANYWEHEQRERRDLNLFLKNPDAVIGPGDTIELPEFTQPWCFMHEAELGLVIKGPAKKISQDRWQDAVFGYTAFMDVTARGQGRTTWPSNRLMSWLGKSFDTFAPIGPCIVTADEIPNPNDLHVRFWNNGQLRHNYNTDDMEYTVPEIIAFATQIMTLHSGNVIACGTNHEGLGFLQDGEQVKIEIGGIGAMELKVHDPLKRQWERGIYMGEDSTHHDAVRRHRPGAVLKP